MTPSVKGIMIESVEVTPSYGVELRTAQLSAAMLSMMEGVTVVLKFNSKSYTYFPVDLEDDIGHKIFIDPDEQAE